jgi:hypothetical protein
MTGCACGKIQTKKSRSIASNPLNRFGSRIVHEGVFLIEPMAYGLHVELSSAMMISNRFRSDDFAREVGVRSRSE